MSIEEELAELSTVYHSQRERMEALEQLVSGYHTFVHDLTPLVLRLCSSKINKNALALQERAKALLNETRSQEGK